MKLTMEVDLTPKEARKLMGLPDVEAMQEKVVDLIYTELQKSIADIKDPKELWQRFMPLGQQGLEQLSKFMPDFAKFGSDDDDDNNDKKK